MPRVPH